MALRSIVLGGARRVEGLASVRGFAALGPTFTLPSFQNLDKYCGQDLVNGLARGGLRGYAKGRQVRPRAPLNRPMGQGVPLKIVFVSPGILVEPWQKAEHLSWQSLLTVDGWKKRWQCYFVNTGKSLYTLSKCMQGIPNFKLRELKVELAELYETINEAAAKGNRKLVQDSVTDKTWTLFKKEMADRKRSGWDKIEWALSEPARSMKVELLQGRVIQVAPEVQFAQLTCKLTSRQTLAAYGASGELVAGSPEEAVEVSEHWVFERGLGKKLVAGAGIRWRLAARL